ncbi:MAG: CsbD family protein [Acidobacteriia bacterium]|nr:CsbD family protein [Terriglobia bacterium]
MKDSTKNKAQGKVHEMKGAVKEKVGQATKNPTLQNKGTDERVGGKIQKKVGQVEEVFEK